jgi:hypothetical protein
MSTNVSNYIKLIVPRSLAGDGEVQARIDAATKEAGGLTTTEGWGDWFDDNGERHVEQVFICQWNFSSSKRYAMSSLTRRVADAMFDHGEKAVMRERYYVYDEGYKAEILYAPTRH